jgi:hypothetical protein
MTEDLEREMLGPRLDAAGANKRRIIFDAEPLFPEDIGRMKKMIERYKVKLMLCDPVNEHLSDGVRRQSDSVRKALKPLKKLAEQTGCAIVLVDHTIKSVGSVKAHPLNAIGGSSSGTMAHGRMIYIVGRDPEDKDRIIMCNVKSQLRDDPLPLEFEMDEADVPGIELPQPLIIEQREITEGYNPMVMLLSQNKGGKAGRPPTKREAALEFLIDYLSAAPNHEARASEIIEDAKQYKVSKRTLEAAKAEAEIQSVKRQNEWWWVLPKELIQTVDESS